MEVGNFVAVARRWWAVLVIATVLAGWCGYLVSAQAPAVYQSRVRLLVGPVNAGMDTLRASGQLSRTYAELVTSRPVLEATIGALDLPERPEMLSAAILPTADSATRLIIIRVNDGDPQRAASIADEVSRQLTAYATGDNQREDGQLTVVDPAAPGTPAGTNPALLVMAAALAGLIGSFTIVLLIDYFQETVHDEPGLVGLTGASSLGTLRALPRWRRRRRQLAALSNSDSARGSMYRVLSTKIELSASALSARSVLIIGSQHTLSAGELSANVAAALTGRERVILIDAAPRSREVSTLLGIEGRQPPEGSADPPRTLHDVLIPCTGGLAVLPVDGANTAMPAGIMRESLALADWVVVHADPVDVSPSTLMWARHVDAVVLVAHAERTGRAEISAATEGLRLAGARLIGTVLETGRAPRWRPTAERLRSLRTRRRRGGSRRRSPGWSSEGPPAHAAAEPHAATDAP